jgi:fructose-1,6-bisphosphatase/inositol monophosphatase family enzyme
VLRLLPAGGQPHRPRVEATPGDVDITPLILIIENAGGVVTTWAGGPAEAGGNCVASATPELHEAALKVLQGG